jgi:Alpha/beta hydrolase family
VLVHGSTHSAQTWDWVRAELERQRQVVVTPELPADEPDAGAARYADAILASIPQGEPAIVVAHSAAGWFLPLVAARRPLRRMVFLAAAVPRIGMSFVELLQAEPEMINPEWIGKDPRIEAMANEFLFHDSRRIGWHLRTRISVLSTHEEPWTRNIRSRSGRRFLPRTLFAPRIGQSGRSGREKSRNRNWASSRSSCQEGIALTSRGRRNWHAYC